MGQTCPGWLVLSQHFQTSSHHPLGSLESPPRSPMQEMRTYTECEQAGKTVGFELVESRDLATACGACGSWYVQDWWSVPCVSVGALQREGSKPQPAMPALTCTFCSSVGRANGHAAVTAMAAPAARVLGACSCPSCSGRWHHPHRLRLPATLIVLCQGRKGLAFGRGCVIMPAGASVL